MSWVFALLVVGLLAWILILAAIISGAAWVVTYLRDRKK